MKVSVSYPFMVLTAALIALDSEGFLLLTWSALVVHELGHMAVIGLLGLELRQLRLGLGGLRIDYGGRQTTYRQDILMALGGPLAGAFCALVLALAARRRPAEWLYVLIGCHGVLTLFNLLPAMPMDGGRVLLAALCGPLGAMRAAKAVRISTGIVGIAITVGGVWLLLESGGRTVVPVFTGVAVLVGCVREGQG